MRVVPHPSSCMWGRSWLLIDLMALAFLLLGWAVQLSAGLTDCSGQSCVFQCSAEITVDLDSSVECGALVGRGTSILNLTCSALQDVLNGLATTSGYDRDDCIVVNLLPGTHTVTHNVTIDQNVVLRGGGKGSVPSPPPSSSPGQVRHPSYSACV